MRKLIDPLRRPGSPIVDIGPTRRIHIVGGTVGEVVGECIFIPPAGLAELAFQPFETDQTPQRLIRQRRIGSGSNHQSIGRRQADQFAELDMLFQGIAILHVTVRIIGIGRCDTHAEHRAVISQHQTLQTDINQATGSIGNVISRSHFDFNGRLAAFIVQVHRLIDVTGLVAGNDFAPNHQVVGNGQRLADTAGPGISLLENILQLLDRNDFTVAEVRIRPYLRRSRRIEIVITADEEQTCCHRQKYGCYSIHILHNINSLSR